MKAIDKFIDRHCHFPEYNGEKFESDLTALIEEACREKDEEIEKLTILLDAAKSSIILLKDLYGW